MGALAKKLENLAESSVADVTISLKSRRRATTCRRRDKDIRVQCLLLCFKAGYDESEVVKEGQQSYCRNLLTF